MTLLTLTRDERDSAVTRRNPNTTLQRYLDEFGWRPESLAARLNDFARRQGFSDRVHEKTPYSWLLKGRTPREPWRSLIPVMLSEHANSSVTLAELGWDRPGSLTRVPADWGMSDDWSPGSALDALGDVTGRKEMRRRTLLVMSVAAITPYIHGWMLRSDRAAAVASGARPDSPTIDAIEGVINGLRRQDDAHGARSVIESASGELSFVVNLLKRGGFNSDIHDRLYAAAAELSRLVAWGKFEVGDYARAQRAFLIGLQAANSGDSPAIGANILRQLGLQIAETGNPAEGASILQSALLGANRSLTPAEKAGIYGNMARAYGRAGDVKAVNSAVDSAFNSLEMISLENTPAHAYWVDSGDISCMVGEAYLALGDFDLAEKYLRQGIEQSPISKRRELSMWRSSLALTYLYSSDIERACDEAHKSLDIAVTLDSPRAANALHRFRQEIRSRRGLHVVRAFDERSQELLAV